MLFTIKIIYYAESLSNPGQGTKFYNPVTGMMVHSLKMKIYGGLDL